MIIRTKSFRQPRGFSLIEMAVVLLILATAFVAILNVLRMLSAGVKAETAHADMHTQTSGAIYDIVAELRQATAYSPNFYVEQQTGVPPRITFDLVAGVDSTGAILWGDTVTYRLVQDPNILPGVSQDLGVVPAQLLRDEVGPGTSGVVMTSVVQDRLPFQFTRNGIQSWGFTVSCDRNALSLSLSRFADTGVNTADVYQDYVPGANKLGTVAITTISGVYFLRNPQAVITLN